MALGGLGGTRLDPQAFRGEGGCRAGGWAGDHKAGPEPLLRLLTPHPGLDR